MKVKAARQRGIWSGDVPILTGVERIACELREVFGDVDTWRRYAPAERTSAAYVLLTDIPMTLACWGWAFEMRQHGEEWTIQASKAIGASQVIRAKARGCDYPDALARLGEALGLELEKANPTRHEPEGVAA